MRSPGYREGVVEAVQSTSRRVLEVTMQTPPTHIQLP